LDFWGALWLFWKPGWCSCF